jgi:TPR repeat protein
MKKFILAIVIALSWQQSAMAGFAEGATAYNNKNYAVALKEIRPLQWHRKAALQGKADAQYVVGAMYYTGNAVIQDHKQAVTWFRKAAEQNHPDALHALGLMYRYHTAGMPQDSVIAYMLWNLAAANGAANAAEQRASVAKTMTHEQIEEGQALSAAWKPGTPLPRQSRTGGG